MRFRALRADEVEARVALVKQNGVSLLLYKDARCDMNLLDETVGAMNWKKSYSRENANCTVSIWDENKKEWVSKEDTGTESFTEKEKGLASDSFKRACFNWGIGRELYTAPFIWITPDKCNIQPKGQGYTCYDRFRVKSMSVEQGRITHVAIVNQRTGAVCFSYGTESVADVGKSEQELNQEMMKSAAGQLIDAAKWNTLMAIARRKGVTYQVILTQYGLKSGSQMTVGLWKEICDRLEQMKDVEG